MPTALALGLAAVLACVAIAALAASTGRGGAPRAGFYTGYATEEPTRDYIPYTGTVAYGTWGVKPWALAADS